MDFYKRFKEDIGREDVDAFDFSLAFKDISDMYGQFKGYRILLNAYNEEEEESINTLKELFRKIEIVGLQWSFPYRFIFFLKLRHGKIFTG